MIIVNEYKPFAVTAEGHVYNHVTGNRLKPHIDKYGYFRVTTKYLGKTVNALVHRLVAIAYLSEKFNSPQVNHIDGNKLNNSIDNLEWVTNQQNADHANKYGLRDSMLGEGSHFNKYSAASKNPCER